MQQRPGAPRWRKRGARGALIAGIVAGACCSPASALAAPASPALAGAVSPTPAGGTPATPGSASCPTPKDQGSHPCPAQEE